MVIKHSKAIIRIVLPAIMLFALGSTVYGDNVPPSQNPPGGLQPAQCPQFVVFGIDDNKYRDGVLWAGEYLRGRVNPAGTGNPATYDKMPARASFYTLALPSYCNYYLQRGIYDLYLDGHEMGNHTLQHLNGVDSSFTVDKWKAEITPGMAFYTDTLRIPAAEIWGFRTPYLAYNNDVFTAIQQMGFIYDCSIEEGEDPALNDTNFYWPYTLDNGSPGANYCVTAGTHEPVDSSHDGLWEMPVYLVIAPPDNECANYGIPTGLRHRLYQNLLALGGDTTWDTTTGRITGLDYNMWFDFNMTKEDYVATLKYTLDKRMAGNRAPFIFGAHSDYYSLQYISEPKNCNTNYITRREAMEEFLTYALSKPEVRVVPVREVIRWMRNPVALNQAFNGPCTLNVSVIDSGFVTVEPEKDSYTKDEQVTLSATPQAGWFFDRWAGTDISGTDTSIVITMYKNISARAVFKKKEPFLDTLNPSANLVSEALWYAEKDDSSKILYQKLIDDTASAGFYQVPKTTDEWPWITFNAHLSSALTTVIGIEVEYQCEHHLIVQFIQPEFETDLSYAHYQYAGKRSETEWNNIRVSARQFYQPDWTPLASKKSLKLNTVREIGFIPAIGEAGDTTSLKVRKLILFYSPTPIITDRVNGNSRRFFIHMIRPDRLLLSVPEYGKYTVKLFSVMGREVWSKEDIALDKGTNTMDIDRRMLAAGVYIARVNTRTLKCAPRKITLLK
jgi:peptidoglycan/xylan/chitin deacetylase (PgdA/CDA1 family)